MLEELRIGNLGVIEESVLELGPGLTVVTGETGAGKTMVVTALALLLGGRADAGAVRAGAKSARVEGVVRADGVDGLVRRAEDVGGEVEDGRLLVARQVSAEGRSRAFVGGVSTPVGTLAQVIGPLVAIHGQSDQHRLLQPAAQRDALDRFAGEKAVAARARFGELFHRLRAVEAELADVTATMRERAREADMLRFGLDEIAGVDPAPGEDTALAAEEERLGHADTLRGAAEQARAALSADDDRPDALGAVSAARKLLAAAADHDPQAAALASRLAEVSYLLSDVAADVASYASGLEADPARLATVSERRAALLALTRKYGDTVDEVLAWAHSSAQRLLELEGTDARVDELTAERSRLLAELTEEGAALTRLRTAAADRLATMVADELTDLAMPLAHVAVTVSAAKEPGPAGFDDVALLLAANAGSEPRPLGKGASGGELSRVMLAVEVALADTHPVPTFVFDEVDAGVGGRAAAEVGRRLALLARGAQVLVVTHLPQVAAYADRHVVVEKSSQGTVTTSGLSVLDEAGRVQELSRMLAGLEGSTSARATPRSCSQRRRVIAVSPERERAHKSGTRPSASRVRPRHRVRMVRAMKFPSRPEPVDELPGVSGPIRMDRRTPSLLRRLRPGDIAVIDHLDLDRATAEALVDRGVVAVVNASPFISGRYPNLGPELLAKAGVVMVDNVGTDIFGRVHDGSRARIDDGKVVVGHAEVASGAELTAEHVDAQMTQARAGLATQLQSFTHNTTEFLRREQDLLLHGQGVPELRTEFGGRPVVVVARQYDYAKDLRGLRRFIREQRPVLVAVDAGADALLKAGHRPDVVVVGSAGLDRGPGSETTEVVSDRALHAAREIVVHADPSGRAPGAERLERLGLRPARISASGATADVALLVADLRGADTLIAVGSHASLDEFLDRQRTGLASSFLTRLRVGPKLVDAKTVPSLYSGRVRVWQLVVVLLAGLIALAVAVAATPVGQQWWDSLRGSLPDLFH